MAAIFYSYTPANDLFLDGVVFKSPIGLGALSSISGEEAFSIVTDVGVTTMETTQFFLTFDDLISYLHFGKGVGQMTVSGLMFYDCQGNLPGAAKLYRAVGSNRGKNVTISIGGTSFTGPLVTSQSNVVSEPDTILQFTITMNMIRHSMGGGASGAGGEVSR